MSNHRVERQSDDAAWTLSLTLPGDAVLYLLLPLHAANFGVSLPEVGLLLAANRLVRIAGYGWVARQYQRRGPRSVCIIAVIAAACAAAGYALFTGLWLLLMARLGWGLAFAALNITTQVLATAEPAGAARRNGRSRAVIAVGSMVGLLAGALLSEILGPRAVFGLLALVALAALPFARRLPSGPGVATAGPRFALPSRLDTWSFVQGLTLDGLFVIGLAVLAGASMPDYAALAAGAALAMRYLAEILLGPVGGSAAERWGAVRLLVALSIASAIGLALIGGGALWTGAIAIVLLRGLLQPLPAPIAALWNPGENRVPAIARLATWRDIGAGVGPLLAGTLLTIVQPAVLYGGAAALLIMAAMALRKGA